jgi:hypothetical protein
MGKYVGKLARITRVATPDESGCPQVRIDIDGVEFFWRVRNMQDVN